MFIVQVNCTANLKIGISGISEHNTANDISIKWIFFSILWDETLQKAYK